MVLKYIHNLIQYLHFKKDKMVNKHLKEYLYKLVIKLKIVFKNYIKLLIKIILHYGKYLMILIIKKEVLLSHNLHYQSKKYVIIIQILPKIKLKVDSI